MKVMMLYSVLLLCTSGLAVACGIYATQGNYKPLTHKLFLLLAGTVAIWALGLAITGAAQTEWICALGRRIAPLGWGLIAGVTLHFVLAFTGRDALLSKWWSYLFIYLPSAVNIFAYSILPLFGLNPDRLEHTPYGWVNVSQSDGADFWDWFYYGYTVVFIAIGTVLLLRWAKRSRSENKKRQARIVAWSFAISSALGAATDIVPAFLNIRFPQVSAIFMIVLILSVGYCISRYQFLQPETVSQEERILSKAELAHVYRYLGLAILLCGIALLLAQSQFRGAPLPALAVGLALAMDGIFLLMLDRASMEEKHKEMLVSLGLALFTPLVLLWFSAVGVQVSWAFLFPMIIICMLFNRQIILGTLLASWMFSALFLWAYRPTAEIRIDWIYFSIRLGVIGFIALSAIYVNRVYIKRLQENRNHTAMQAIATEISQNFVSVSAANIEKKLYQTLERCGKFIQCDTAYFIMPEPRSGHVRYAVEWSAEFPSPLRPASEFALRPELFANLGGSNILFIRDAARMPAGPLKRQLLAQCIRGFISVPIKNESEATGFLGFTADRPLRKWNLGTPVFMQIAAGILSDAVTKVDAERALTHMAYHDQLTGLPNRHLLRKKLEEAIAAAGKAQCLMGVILLDLDGFKSVNDMLGHDQGDRLLIEVASALSGMMRTGDMAARLGGDEFVLLLNGLSTQKELLRFMDHLMETIQKPVILAQQEFFISISAGVALYPQDGEDADSLLKNADATMYAAKNSGKSKYMLCSQSVTSKSAEKLRLTNLLYRALENGELALHYQPQIDLASQRIAGLEALLRWNLPGSGVIGPGAFIPLAEQTGLIHSIGAWALQEACSACSRFHAMGCTGLRMAVNVSVHQLKNPNFVEVVSAALQKAGLPARYLELEITESIACGNPGGIAAALRHLKEVGVSISMDDFGTEYSSLRRLKELPIDRIKVDMRFVHGIEKSAQDQEISKVFIGLAKSLRLQVTAEGVETAPQLDFLSQRRCDEVQGYYYYRPMPFAELTPILCRQL